MQVSCRSGKQTPTADALPHWGTAGRRAAAPRANKRAPRAGQVRDSAGGRPSLPVRPGACRAVNAPGLRTCRRPQRCALQHAAPLPRCRSLREDVHILGGIILVSKWAKLQGRTRSHAGTAPRPCVSIAASRCRLAEEHCAGRGPRTRPRTPRKDARTGIGFASETLAANVRTYAWKGGRQTRRACSGPGSGCMRPASCVCRQCSDVPARLNRPFSRPSVTLSRTLLRAARLLGASPRDRTRRQDRSAGAAETLRSRRARLSSSHACSCMAVRTWPLIGLIAVLLA